MGTIAWLAQGSGLRRSLATRGEEVNYGAAAENHTCSMQSFHDRLQDRSDQAPNADRLAIVIAQTGGAGVSRGRPSDLKLALRRAFRSPRTVGVTGHH